MKPFVTAIIVLVVALAFGAARAGADGVSFGVNDNAGLYEDGTGPFWDTMTGLGLTTNTITLRFDETTADGLDPTDKADLGPALAAARKAGVTIEFDVYPRHARELADPSGPSAVRRVPDDAGHQVSGRPPVRRDERVQPGHVREPAVTSRGAISLPRGAARFSRPATTRSRRSRRTSSCGASGCRPAATCPTGSTIPRPTRSTGSASSGSGIARASGRSR